MEPLSVFFILIPIGLAIGIFAAITGLGGGVLMVPILFYAAFLMFDPVAAYGIVDVFKYATTISSTVIIFTAISATIAFSFQKRIDYLVGILCVPFTIAGSFLGKFAQSKIDENYVLIFFAILLFLTAVRMIYKVISSRRKEQLQNANDVLLAENPEKENPSGETPSRFKLLLEKLTLDRDITDKSEKKWEYKVRLYLTPIAIIGGFVASMAGVGGGIVMVPVLHIFIGLPIHFSTATSVFIMIFTKSTTIITAYTTTIETTGIWWPYVAGLAIGIVCGAQIGARLARRIKADPLKVIFATVLILVSIWTIVQWQLGI
ncbi:MAG: sulfite exporter TauE/SafE family protein [Asgard group archaeon]|nr:sulfite exporter TauE/SafE family protein [Asgard group archaeon]